MGTLVRNGFSSLRMTVVLGTAGCYQLLYSHGNLYSAMSLLLAVSVYLVSIYISL